MKTLLQTGPDGRVPLPPEKRFLIRPKLSLETDDPRIMVVIPHPSPDAAIDLAERLDADATYTAASRAAFDATTNGIVYMRFSTRLLLSFSKCPKLECAARGPDRLMQFRMYKSPNDDRAMRKASMFNESGEIALFRRAGLNPVFFGRSVAGDVLPNLAHMLGFENQAVLDAAWKTFLADPEWDALKKNPLYPNTVSHITNWIMRPLSGSQL